jgi:predicted N-formylglutamate amidohydrolase
MNALSGDMVPGTEEPPVVTVINEQACNGLLLAGDHVSNAIPRAMHNLGLEQRALQHHIAYDIGTLDLIRHLSSRLNAPAVLAGYSRLVIDLNRNPKDPTLIPETSDGMPIPGNQGLDENTREHRLRIFYDPYRHAIDRMLRLLESGGRAPALISIHSFTPHMMGVKRPWHIGLMWDKDPRIPVPLLAGLRAHPQGLVVGDNQPYSGKLAADYTIDHHAEAAGFPHVSIEIRQDTIDTSEGVLRWADILEEVLSDILDDPKLYCVLEHSR